MNIPSYSVVNQCLCPKGPTSLPPHRSAAPPTSAPTPVQTLTSVSQCDMAHTPAHLHSASQTLPTQCRPADSCPSLSAPHDRTALHTDTSLWPHSVNWSSYGEPVHRSRSHLPPLQIPPSA